MKRYLFHIIALTLVALVGRELHAQTFPSTQQEIRLFNTASSQYISLTPPSNLASTYSLILPGSQGAAGSLLTNNGSGTLSWTTILPVENGGTGASTLTGLILGNGTSPMTTVTTSAGLAGAISDETGSGLLVFATAPTLTTLTVSSGGAVITGNSSVTGTLGVTGAVTLTSLNGAARTSVPAGYDRIVIASSDGVLDEASISSVVSAGVAGSAWSLTGNTGTTNGGTLGSAPSVGGNVVGTTGTSTNARDLSFVTNNVIQMQISTAGVVSTQNDMRVNGITIGRATGNLASNTVMGSGAMAVNTTGFDNTAVGLSAMAANTSGYYNVALGSGALTVNTTGNNNVSLGYRSLYSNTTGEYNIAVGSSTLLSNVGGHSNVAIGDQTMRSNTSGYQNIAIGKEALRTNTSGYANVAVGQVAMYSNTTAFNNTAVGYSALYATTTGSWNTGLGRNSLLSNTTGQYNTASGFDALQGNTLGSFNVAFGSGSLYTHTTGNYNTALGYEALNKVLDGSNNVAIGNSAGFYETGSDKLYIANGRTNNLIFGDFSVGRVAINGGGVGATPPSTPGASLQVNAFNASTVGMIIKGAASASANLLEVQRSDGTVLLNVNNNGSLTLDAFGASAGNTNELRFEELVANGSNYVGFKAPDAITSNRIWTLPAADGNNGQVLSTNGGGTLSWATVLTSSTGWTTSGNSGTNNGGMLGSAPTGSYVGTSGTAANARDLSFVTNNIIQMQISATGTVSTQNDAVVNGVTVGKGGGNDVSNTAIGYQVLNSNTGTYNNAFGFRALHANTTGTNNSAFGTFTLWNNTSAGANSAFGSTALFANTTGASNSAFGYDALRSNTTGNDNTVMGGRALRHTTTGSGNVAIGYYAGFFTSGSANVTALDQSVLIGSNSMPLADGNTNTIVIGNNARGLGSNTAVIGNASIIATRLQGNVGIGADPTTAASDAKLQVSTSASSIKGLVVKGAVSQSANLLELQNSGGTPQLSVGPTGATTIAGTLTLSSTAQAAVEDSVLMINASGQVTKTTRASLLSGASAWALTGGNSITSSGGTLGSAPTGQWLGTSNGQDLRLATNNAVRMIVSNTGAITMGGMLGVTGATTLSSTLGVTGLITGNAGATISGATTSINASSNFNTNINTGSSTGMVAIGNAASTTTMLGTTGITGATTINTSGTAGTTIGSATSATSVGGTLGVTGATTLSSTLGVTGAVTLTSLNGTARTSVPAGYDRIVIASSDGVLEEASISSVVGNSGWSLAGNIISSPSTQFLGTTNGAPLVIRTDNAERARMTSAGQLGIGTTLPQATLDVVGDMRSTNFHVRNIERNLPTTVGDAVAIGSFNLHQGSGALWVSVTVPTNGFSSTKQYLLPIAYNEAADWTVAQPISETGVYVGNDFELDIKVSAFLAELRLRRVSGTIAATAKILIKQEGADRSTDPFTESSTVTTVTAPATFYGATSIRQVDGRVGIKTAAPAHDLDLAGTLRATGTVTLTSVATGAAADDVLLINSSNQVTKTTRADLLAGTGWALTGNTGTTNGGTLGSAPTGSVVGTTGTAANARDLSFVTNNVIQMQINTAGVVSTQNDVIVNGLRVGRGAGSVASNTAVGSDALLVNTSGANNTAIGFRTLYAATTGTNNTAIGYQALTGNTTGSSNVAIGTSALQSNTAGLYNTAVGVTAGRGLTGSSNTAIGWGALDANNSGSGNVAIGFEAGYNESGSNKLYIANSASNNLIYGDFSTGVVSINAGATPSAPGATLQVNAFNASTVGMIIKGAASASANLFEAQNSAGTALVSISSAGLITSTAGINLSGSTAPLQVGGSAGTSGQVLTSAGAGATPTWTSATAAVGIKSKGVSALQTAVNTYDVTLATLDAGDAITVTLEGADANAVIPSHFVVRTVSSKFTVHFSAPFTGYINWTVMD